MDLLSLVRMFPDRALAARPGLWTDIRVPRRLCHRTHWMLPPPDTRAAPTPTVQTSRGAGNNSSGSAPSDRQVVKHRSRQN